MAKHFTFDNDAYIHCYADESGQDELNQKMNAKAKQKEQTA